LADSTNTSAAVRRSANCSAKLVGVDPRARE
jgi:hypothetical protein